ncbi:MAG: TetR family transcriptional regulator [Anaerolineaceae bacterium]
MNLPGRARSGRRPGQSETRAQILRAAREAFGRESYEGATIRSIALAAGVDPALVIHFFGSKAGLFSAAMELPYVPAEAFTTLIRGEPSELGERFARFFVELSQSEPARGRFLGLIRSAVSEAAAAAMLNDYIVAEVFGPLTSLLRLPMPELRAALVASQFVGLMFSREILGLEALTSADCEPLVALLAPTFQGYLSSPSATG